MKIHSVRSTVAFTLACILLLLTFPWQAFAATALNTGTIVISNTQQQGTYDILYDGLDIYLQAADFEKITRYTYRETEETIAYTLGQKTLVISKSGKHPVQIPALGVYANYGLTLKGIVQSGGKTYISVSELLPWLNVSVSEKDGMLIVVPDDISFWEVCADLNSSKDLFNLSRDFGDSAISKTGLAAMLTYNLVTGLKLDNVLDNTNTDEVISSYEKIYIDMSTDETLLSGEANAFVNKIYTANNNIDTVEKVFGVNEGAFHNKAAQTLLEQGMTDEWQAFEDFATTWDDVRTTISAAKTVADYLPLLKTMKLLETQFYTTQDYKTYLSKLTKSGTRTGVEVLALKKVNAELESRQSAAEVTLLSSLTKNLRKVLQNPQVSDNPFCEDISLYLIASNLFYSTILTVNPAFSDMSNIATYSSIMNRSWSEGVQYTSQVATKDNLLMATESYKVALKASKTCFNTLQKTTDIRLLGFIKALGDTSTLMKYRTDPIDQKIAALSVTAKYRENDSVEGKEEYRKKIQETLSNCKMEIYNVSDEHDSNTENQTPIKLDSELSSATPKDKSYTMEDIYELINLRKLLSEHISVTRVFDSDEVKTQLFQSDGHLGLIRLLYDSNGNTSINYFCSSDYEPFGLALNDDGFDRFLNVYLSSDMDDWIVFEWDFLCSKDDVKTEEIVDTQVEDEVVKIVTSGLDAWDHSFTHNYYIDNNSGRIIRCELSDTVKYDILYDLPVFEASDFVNEFIDADDGNEITIISKISGYPGECSIRVAPDVDWSVGWWTHSPIAVYADEALLNKTYLTSDPGTYYVGEDLEYN